ncbi:MAG: alpha/beta hydrolase, partial [Gemmatimonadales bacterium]
LEVPAERIVVFGHSLGSAVAIELVSRVPAAGLVLDGALTSVVELAQELFPYAPVRWIAASRYLSIERVGALTIPKLFLHARQDDVVPFVHGRRLFDAAAPPKQFVPLQGGHGDAFEADSAAYFGAIGRFVAELDRGVGT